MQTENTVNHKYMCACMHIYIIPMSIKQNTTSIPKAGPQPPHSPKITISQQIYQFISPIFKQVFNLCMASKYLISNTCFFASTTLFVKVTHE